MRYRPFQDAIINEKKLHRSRSKTDEVYRGELYESFIDKLPEQVVFDCRVQHSDNIVGLRFKHFFKGIFTAATASILQQETEIFLNSIINNEPVLNNSCLYKHRTLVHQAIEDTMKEYTTLFEVTGYQEELFTIISTNTSTSAIHKKIFLAYLTPKLHSKYPLLQDEELFWRVHKDFFFPLNTERYLQAFDYFCRELNITDKDDIKQLGKAIRKATQAANSTDITTLLVNEHTNNNQSVH